MSWINATKSDLDNIKKKTEDAKNRRQIAVREASERLNSKFHIPYDNEDFKQKINTDKYIFNSLLNENINPDAKEFSDSDKSLFENLYLEYLNIEKQIYLIYNTKPSIYNETNIDKTEKELKLIAENSIVNYMHKNYYDISNEERLKRYGQDNQDYMIKLFHENQYSDIEEEFTKNAHYNQKAQLLKGFITEVTFPKKDNVAIRALLKNKEYCEMFESSKLEELLDDIDEKIEMMSKIIAIYK